MYSGCGNSSIITYDEVFDKVQYISISVMIPGKYVSEL